MNRRSFFKSILISFSSLLSERFSIVKELPDCPADIRLQHSECDDEIIKDIKRIYAPDPRQPGRFKIIGTIKET